MNHTLSLKLLKLREDQQHTHPPPHIKSQVPGRASTEVRFSDTKFLMFPSSYCTPIDVQLFPMN